MSTIPASFFVDAVPSVLSAGGNALNLNGLCLTKSTRVPIGTVQSFSSPTDVADFFGPTSHEAFLASIYFAGYTNGQQTPGAMLFAQYPQSAVSAYLRGGDISALTLAQLRALTGSLNVTIDGYEWSASIDLSSASSFSAAAALLQSGLQGTDPQEAAFTASVGASFTGNGSGTNLTASSVTGLISIGDVVVGAGVPSGTTIVSQTSGTAGGAGVYVTSQATTASTAALTTLSNVLNVSAIDSGTLAIGQTVDGSGIAANVTIAALGTGEGLDGTYILSSQQAAYVASESMTAVATPFAVTYDSVSGAFVFTSGITGPASLAAFATGSLAASLLLTSATGAVISQGAAAATPSAFMGAVTQLTQNWATFFTAFDPDSGSGNTQKLAFAAWTNSVAPRYAYLAWDKDQSPRTTLPATSSLGYLLQQNDYSGTAPISELTDNGIAAFVAGTAASIDFDQPNGRITFAFKSQTGLVADVTDATTAANLGGNPQQTGSYGNGYNYYAAVATANQQFVNFQRGTISGPYQWLDSYINQIYLTSQLQLALMELLTTVGSIPYNQQGYDLIDQTLAGPLNDFLSFGGARAGVTLSAQQILAINNAAGANIAGTLAAQGYYIQVLNASSQVRESRASPPITVWYVDGESVQAITLGSILVQ